MIERRPPKTWRAARGGVFDLLGLRAERDPLAADVDLDRIGEPVQEPFEGSDVGGLLVRASQLEARPLCANKQAVAALCELDEPVGEDSPHRNVKRRAPRLARRAWKGRRQSFGCE